MCVAANSATKTLVYIISFIFRHTCWVFVCVCAMNHHAAFQHWFPIPISIPTADITKGIVSIPTCHCLWVLMCSARISITFHWNHKNDNHFDLKTLKPNAIIDNSYIILTFDQEICSIEEAHDWIGIRKWKRKTKQNTNDCKWKCYTLWNHVDMIHSHT